MRLRVFIYVGAIALGLAALGAIFGQLFILSGSKITPANSTHVLATPGSSVTVDYVYPGFEPHWYGALRTTAWVDVPLPTDRARIRSIRIFTGAKSWGFSLCGSKTRMDTCRYSVVKGSSIGWQLDYADAQADHDYEDLDGNATPEAHFLVSSFNGDWMTVRVQMEVQAW